MHSLSSVLQLPLQTDVLSVRSSFAELACSLFSKSYQGTNPIFILTVCSAPEVAYADISTRAVVFIFTIFWQARLQQNHLKKVVENVSLRESGVEEAFFPLINKL